MSEVTRIENGVLCEGKPVYKSLDKIAKIQHWKKNSTEYQKEFKKLLSLMREHMNSVKPEPRSSVYICGGTSEQRAIIAKAFIHAATAGFAATNEIRNFQDLAFVAEPGLNFAEYAGQPCVWFDEMDGYEFTNILKGRYDFLHFFEPYPFRPFIMDIPYGSSAFAHTLNVVTSEQTPEVFMDIVNKDGRKRVKEQEDIRQIRRRLPVIIEIGENGTFQILLNGDSLDDPGTYYHAVSAEVHPEKGQASVFAYVPAIAVGSPINSEPEHIADMMLPPGAQFDEQYYEEFVFGVVTLLFVFIRR